MPEEHCNDSNKPELVTIDRKEFAALWHQWEQSEHETFSKIYDLLTELQNTMETLQPLSQSKFEMLNLFFTEEEQNLLFRQWESEGQSN